MAEVALLLWALALDATPDQDPGEAPEEAAAEAPVSRDPPGSFEPYQLAQPQRSDVLEGPPRVAVETNGPAPETGGMAVRVFVDNGGGPATTLTLRFRSANGSAGAERAVPLEAGERRTVNLPVMAGMDYGVLTASVPGRPSGQSTVFFHTPPGLRGAVVLSLGTPQAFERLAGRPPEYDEAPVQVHAVPPAEAPQELLAYAGYEAVVVPDPGTLAQLDEAQRRALEAYAATGGTLVLGGPPPSWSWLPLARPGPGAGQGYGFGSLQVLGAGATLALRRGDPVVEARGPRAAFSRGRPLNALLPQAAAPLASFLAIIALFTLAIGPGSAWVARRFRPAALLLTIPATALATCALLVGYSLFAEGLAHHAARYGLTLLDGPRHRAITVGLSASYANLSLRQASFSLLTAPLEGGPGPGARHGASVTWDDGLRLGPDFLPAREYREWGLLSVEPTRARLTVVARGPGLVVQNALGYPVAWVHLERGGRLWRAEAVPEGGERALAPEEGTGGLVVPAADRFSAEARAIIQAPLGEGQFLALVEGPGFVATGGYPIQLEASGHLVRGEVER